MACEIAQKAWSDIGIEIKIHVVEWSAFLKEFIHKKKFDAVLLAWQLAPDPDIYDIFHSSKQAPGNFNFISFSNKEADALMEEGRRTFDLEKRKTGYHRLHALLAEEEPYPFLYVEEALPIVHKRFEGVELGLAGLGHNFTKWYVPSDKRRYKL